MSNLEHSISFRVNEQMFELIKERAEQAGCNSISEFARRKTAEDESDSMREVILFIKEMVLSALAHHNVILDVAGVKVEDRDNAVQQYKIDILEAWNNRNR